MSEQKSYIQTVFEDNVYYLRRERERLANDIKRERDSERHAKEQIEKLNKQINDLYDYYDEVFQAAMSLGIYMEVGLNGESGQQQV